MKWNLEPYQSTLIDYAKALLAQDSPSGFTQRAELKNQLPVSTTTKER